MSLETSPSILYTSGDCLKVLEGDDALCKLMTMFKKCKDSLKDGYRLENISWRLWYCRVGQHINSPGPPNHQYSIPELQRMPLRKNERENVNSQNDCALRQSLSNETVLAHDHNAIGKCIVNILYDLEDCVRVPSKMSIHGISPRTESPLVTPLLTSLSAHMNPSCSIHADTVARKAGDEALHSQAKRKIRSFKVASSRHPKIATTQSTKAKGARKAFVYHQNRRRDLIIGNVASECGGDTDRASEANSSVEMRLSDEREEGVKEWRQESELFVKLPRQSYCDTNRQRRSLLTELLNTENMDVAASHVPFIPNLFPRAASNPIHEHPRSVLARGVAAPPPNKVPVQAVSDFGNRETRRHTHYRPKAPPPDQEFEDDSDS